MKKYQDNKDVGIQCEIEDGNETQDFENNSQAEPEIVIELVSSKYHSRNNSIMRLSERPTEQRSSNLAISRTKDKKVKFAEEQDCIEAKNDI